MDEQRSERIRTAYRLGVTVMNRLGDRLPADQAGLLRTFIGVGEYELFFESLCGTLVASGIPVTPAEVADISALGVVVEGTVPQTGRYLRDLVVRNEVGAPERPNASPTFVVAPPANFYELSEADQLAWTRQVGEQVRAGEMRPAVAIEEDG